ncbi:cell wall metabolism sensor histidine kinase WalK [Nocardioides sp. SYSU D00065]|uniref:sensor histidine kinase n=1 Tax=Nocardioides sp. SYSU D00065 TaxID=2817378 RepID=UPI001B31BCF6|nr:HAMP domain-containing sensor histidine kinase [Nocardioides sp. SYSU D00065]
MLRLFALVAVVALCSVLATAWLTAQVTIAGLRETQGDVLEASDRVADALSEYASTHSDWSGAQPLVQRLAEGTGQRITVTDVQGTVLVDSTTSGAPLPDRPSARIDVLNTYPTGGETPTAATDAATPCPDGTTDQGQCAVSGGPYAAGPPDGSPIDPRATGPLALNAAERETSRRRADRLAACLRATTRSDVQVETTATGRSVVRISGAVPAVPTSCDLTRAAAPLPSEIGPLALLNSATNACTRRQDGPKVDLTPDLGWTQRLPRTTASDAVVQTCLTDARRELLTAHVAPPALLFVTRPRQQAAVFLDLSTGNWWRILGLSTLVLVISLGFAAVAGRQLVGPLAALTTAVRQMRGGDLSARAEVRRRDEVGGLAAAFNAMAESRERDEMLRKAMVADVAHELRNPLSTIRGALEGAQDGLLDTDSQLVDSLLEETLLLQHVVEDLRDLAAADAGDLRLTIRPLPVAAVVDQVLAAHAQDAADGGVRLVNEVAASLVVAADGLRVRQLLGNLVTNAVRHTPPGGSVRVSATLTDGWVTVDVRDTGEGIPASQLPHVFDRFWRADPSRTRASGGSGLGLAIVRQLTEAHGGSVAVTSTVSEGSTFSVRLPVADTNVDLDRTSGAGRGTYPVMRVESRGRAAEAPGAGGALPAGPTPQVGPRCRSAPAQARTLS